MRFSVIIMFSFLLLNGFAQYTINRVNWQDAGYNKPKPVFNQTVSILSYGGNNTGSVSNNTAFNAAVAALSGKPGVIYFPAGVYLFSSQITIARDSILFKGAGYDSTCIRFNLGGLLNNCINIAGSQINSDTTSFSQSAVKDSASVMCMNASAFQPKDWVYLTTTDNSLMASSWAYGSLGQIMQVKTISGNNITFEHPFRYTYSLSLQPRITKLAPRSNVGFECMKVRRMDATTNQTSLFTFDKAVYCWMKGVEGDSTNFAHVELNRSSNIEITGSYFHHAFAYGGSGQGYGILFQFSSGECKAEGNVFRHLRHSMIMQAGANGNVCGYNYSTDTYWNEPFFPTNSAGDMVLHGNYVFSNLFEGNIGQNIVIDDSHGKNGPYNTFFRNRAELYGILMNNSPATDYVQFLGNEVTNSSQDFT